MANLTLQDLQNEVYMHLGVSPTTLDPAGNAYSTDVLRWLNYVQQDICARWPWTFMESTEQIVTVPDYTTGLIRDVNFGSTDVEGSGTPSTNWTSALNGYYIQISSANDWYLIANVNNVNSLRIATPYQQTENATQIPYIIRKFYYSLSSACDRIVSIVNWNTPVKLIQVDMRTINIINPLVQSTNSSYAYVAWGYDSSRNVQIIPYPFPTDSRVLQFKTIKRPTDFVLSTDLPSIPNKYAHLIAWGAIAIGFAFKGKDWLDMAASWSTKFEQRLAQMRMEYKMTDDPNNVLASIDSIQRSKWIAFPGQYPSLAGS